MSGFVTLTDSSGNAVTATNPQPVQLGDGNGIILVNPLSADASAAQKSVPAFAQNGLFNGATWDRQRGNVDTGALLTLTAQGLGTVNGTDQVNYNGRGLKLIIDVTAISGTSPT